MLILTCPNCGETKDESELRAHGEAHISRAGPEATDEEMETYLFERVNPKGVHFERWHCTYGCGKWFHAARCTMTLEVFGTYPAQTTEPPQEIIDILDKKRPGWSWRNFGGTAQ